MFLLSALRKVHKKFITVWKVIWDPLMIGNEKSEISVLMCDDSMWLYVGVVLDYPEYVPLPPLQQTIKRVLGEEGAVLEGRGDVGQNPQYFMLRGRQPGDPGGTRACLHSLGEFAFLQSELCCLLGWSVWSSFPRWCNVCCLVTVKTTFCFSRELQHCFLLC